MNQVPARRDQNGEPMRGRFAAAALTLALIFAGCAAQGPPFQRATAPPDNATIYVYRPYSYAGSLLRPPVTCGGQSARIGPGGYHAFILPAGHVVCHVQGAESADDVDLDAQPRVYYIRERISWGVLRGHPQLDPQDTDKAQGEIQQCCVEER
ncbi:MAG TPA: hypothetical protein VFB33_01795 [Candidatus Binataceae bacterium]|jgi:hypothetical protein|nr:hypothetical protein [Candidatus Binataceae bacterium]